MADRFDVSVATAEVMQEVGILLFQVILCFEEKFPVIHRFLSRWRVLSLVGFV